MIPYQNEIIFFAGYGAICIFVLFIYLVLSYFIIFAVSAINHKINSIGNLAHNAKALIVLKRINRRKAYLKQHNRG